MTEPNQFLTCMVQYILNWIAQDSTENLDHVLSRKHKLGSGQAMLQLNRQYLPRMKSKA